MPDNTLFQASLDPAQPRIADKEVLHAGDLAKVQIILLSEVLGSEGAYTLRELTALDTIIGQLADAAAGSDTADASLNALVKRLLQRMTTLIGHVDALETLLGSQIAATPTSVGSGTADAQVIAATPNLRLLGFSGKEDAATPAEAEFVLRHGTSAAGTPLAHVNLGPNESIRDWFGPGGMAVASGIFLDRVSGTTDLVVHTVVAP